MEQVQDAELARAAREGDRDAFGELVRRYAGQARRVALSVLRHPEDADDAAQDGLLSAVRNLDQYDPDRPFGPWLMRVVANAATDRRRRLRVRRTDEISPLTAADAPGPDMETDRHAFHAALREALAELPDRQRMAIVLFDVEGYSHAEIAEMLEIPSGTVRSDVFHARRRLRDLLAAWKGWKPT